MTKVRQGAIGKHIFPSSLLKDFLTTSDRDYQIEVSMLADDNSERSEIKVPLQIGHEFLLFAFKRRPESSNAV